MLSVGKCRACGKCNYHWILKLLNYSNMKLWPHLDIIRERAIFYRSVRSFVRTYVCIYRFQNVFLRCPTPRLHCFLSSHWPSLRFLSFMAFFITSIQFFFGLPRALFCFGIHFNLIKYIFMFMILKMISGYSNAHAVSSCDRL